MTSCILLFCLWALALAGLLFRPWKTTEALWTTAAALLVPVLGLLDVSETLHAVRSGLDVYLFLFGMMVLSETARREKLFDWLAAFGRVHARGSGRRLFAIVFCVAILTTAFLSNDATIVLLTPPVIAVCNQSRISPFPSLLACALVANAASFVLPISNPANLVLYGGAPPPLLAWLRIFLIPSCLAIGTLFLTLYWLVRRDIAVSLDEGGSLPQLDSAAKVTAVALTLSTVLLTVTSFLHGPLGLATAICGCLVAILVWCLRRHFPLESFREISWSVFPLVAGLFILVAALENTPLIHGLARLVLSFDPPWLARLATGFGIGALSNIMNNLPSGLLAAQLAPLLAHSTGGLPDALLVGVDLGPNFTLSGSLATVLWLIILRKHGLDMGYIRFMRYGVVVTLPALALALLALK